MEKIKRTKIICYGDSNTYGFRPTDGGRYSKNIRWTGVLADILGDEYSVTEEGCNNRTGFLKCADGFIQSGKEYFPTCINNNSDLDILILALGTNDIQKFYNPTEQIINEGLSFYVNFTRQLNKNIKIIFIPPVKLSENILDGYFAFQFNKISIARSEWIQDIYYRFANDNGIKLFDINKYVTPSKTDGLHFEPVSHKRIAEKLVEIIKNKF